MAEVPITAANVEPKAGATLVTRQASEPISAGKTMYVDANEKWALGDNDTAAKADIKAFAVSTAEKANQYVTGVSLGDVIIVTGASESVAYYQASTPGNIELESDLASGEFVTQVCVGKAAGAELKVKINATGIQKP